MTRWNPGETMFVGGSMLGGGGIATAINQPMQARVAPAAEPAAAADPSALGPVTPEWRRWIAENLLMDRDPQTIVDAMVRDGLDGNAAVREVRAAMQHPYLLAARQITAGVAPGALAAAQQAAAQAAAARGTGDATAKVKKREWVLECQRRAARQATTFGEVPRVRKPNRAEFLDRFYSQNKPVVIEGAMDDWPAMKLWTADYLKVKLGDRVVEVQANRNSDANYELNQTKLKQEMTFAQFVDITETAGQTNNWYITANNSGKNKENLKELWDDIVLFPDYLRDDPGNNGFFWFGPAGTVTPLHHDLTNNFMAQVRGRKLVRLIAPHDLAYLYNNRHCYSPVNLDAVDHARYPQFRNAKVIDVVIGPGDLLFLPVGWWHYVRGLDISITMTFTNFVYDNDFYSFYETYQDI